MSGPSKIEWTERTWNPIVGCSIVSPGCTNCYAMRMAARIEAINAATPHVWKGGTPHYAGLTKKVKNHPVWTGKVARADADTLHAPLRRKKPTVYFVNSMSDLFHEAIPDEWIDQVFAVMALAPQHNFQVLTKRAERMRAYLDGYAAHVRIERLLGETKPSSLWNGSVYQAAAILSSGRPLPNVWLGVSTEDQRRAEERIPHLLATPAAVRFVSAEPLLGPIDFDEAWHGENALDSECWGECAWCTNGHPPLHNCQRGKGDWEKGRSGLDWIIVGGESGPGARPMHPDWARSIRDQCAAASVPFFFKQWGAWGPSETTADRMIVAADGDIDIPDNGTADEESGEAEMARLGKKAAGRLLDGVEHNGMPGGQNAR